MSQVTLYLPDDLEKELRRGAKRARKSLSSYVAELASKRGRSQGWPQSFVKTFGSWKGRFPKPIELEFEEREDL